MPPSHQRYLLDSDIYGLWLQGNVQVILRVSQTPEDCLWISAITVQEILQGWLNRIERERPSPKDNICRLYDELIGAMDELYKLNVLYYTPQAHQVFNAMSASAKRIGTNDRRIAASAIAHDMIVVTRNTRHFERIGGVRYEDWSVAPDAE